MSKIKFNDMVRALAKDGQELIDGLTPESAHILHMGVGVDGEIGELIENHLSNGSRKNKVEELGDIEFYYQGFIQDLNVEIGVSNELTTGSIDRLLLQLSCAGSNLLDAAKKYSIYEKELDLEEAVNQLTNVRIKLTQLYNVWGISRNEAEEANIKKLGDRYASGSYSNKQAQNRADKK